MAGTEQTPKLKGSLELFTPSMDAVKVNLGTFIWLALVPSLVFMFFSALDSRSENITTNSWQFNTTQTVAFGGTAMLIVLFSIFVGLVLAPALVHLQIQSARHKKVDVANALQTGLRYLLRFFGLMVLYGLLVMGGLLLLIVPGLIMIRRYFLAPYYLIDKDLGIREAMRRSAAATKPHSGSIWGLIGVNILLSVPSFIPVIGQVISLIFTTLYSVAPALRYDELRHLEAKS